VLTDALIAESLRRGKLAEREMRQALGLEPPAPDYRPRKGAKPDQTKQQRVAAQRFHQGHHEGD
jgi:ribosome maturation factor RimP